MNSIQSYQFGLSGLPPELLMHIIEFAKEDSLLSLSLVSQIFRQLCVPHIFQTLKVTFSTTGLDNLIQISNSQIVQHIRELVYEVSERIDPRMPANLNFYLTHSLLPS